jgi:hypothetical protein
MSLVFAGVCSHAPGIVGRKDRADPVLRDGLYAAYDRMRFCELLHEQHARHLYGHG